MSGRSRVRRRLIFDTASTDSSGNFSKIQSSSTISGSDAAAAAKTLLSGDSKTDSWLDVRLNQINEEHKKRWQFNFQEGTPLPPAETTSTASSSDWRWSKVPAKEVPQLYWSRDDYEGKRVREGKGLRSKKRRFEATTPVRAVAGCDQGSRRILSRKNRLEPLEEVWGSRSDGEEPLPDENGGLDRNYTPVGRKRKKLMSDHLLKKLDEAATPGDRKAKSQAKKHITDFFKHRKRGVKKSLDFSEAKVVKRASSAPSSLLPSPTTVYS